MCETDGRSDLAAAPDPYPNGRRDGEYPPALDQDEGGSRGVSRRALLGGGVALAAGIVGYRWFEDRHPIRHQVVPLTPRPVGFDGRPPTLMAMHLHASFSQGKASYLKHFTEAATNQVDVIWFTEHDWRMSAKDYRSAIHFDTLRGEKEEERGWTWVEVSDPNLTSHKATIVSSPVSPKDPSPTPGALSISAVSSDGQEASNRMAASTGQSRDNYRGTIAGQSIALEVFPTSVGPDAWLELRLELSDSPRIGGRAAGTYILSYRFTTHPAASSAQGQLGIVPIAVRPNEWNSITVRPDVDVAALWPDMLARDNAIFQLWLGATSSAQGTAAEGAFDYMRFHRTGQDGDRPLGLQAQILSHYAPQFPTVTAYAGLEASFYEDHLSQFGGQIHLPQYNDPDANDVKPPKTSSSHTQALADLIKHNGGLASLNHPLGLTGPGVVKLTQLRQDTLRRSVTDVLLRAKMYGIDMVEVGYQDRGGMLFDAHFQLACSLWRNSLFVTANGASDDHNANGYSSIVNRFHTGVFSNSRSQEDLLAELQAGRAFVSMLHDGPSLMDLRLDDNPMGSVSVRPGGQRTLRLMVARPPSKGTVEIIRGTVDDAGPQALDPDLHTVTTVAAADMRDGQLSVPVDASSSVFFLARVRDGDGHTVGFTNPCWSLTALPPGGVPAARRAPDTVA